MDAIKLNKNLSIESQEPQISKFWSECYQTNKDALITNRDMVLELCEKEGQILMYQQEIIKLSQRVKQLEKKCKKQEKLIKEKETEEVLQLVGDQETNEEPTFIKQVNQF